MHRRITGWMPVALMILAATQGGCSKDNEVNVGDICTDDTACDDKNPCTKDTCKADGACENAEDPSAKPSEGSCHTGGKYCGLHECWNGTECRPGVSDGECGMNGGACVSCDADLPCFESGKKTCNAGKCEGKPLADGTECKDPGTGTCHSGECCAHCWDEASKSCKGGTAQDACGANGKSCEDCSAKTTDPCKTAECGSGICMVESVDDGTPCNNGAGVCQAGICCSGCLEGTSCVANPVKTSCGAKGEACVDCDDKNECTDDACVAGSCDHAANTATCNGGKGVCVDKVCECGGTGQPCCEAAPKCKDSGQACNASNTCGSCGAKGETCCASGDACAADLACDAGTNQCVDCGAIGQPCCGSDTCDSGAVCNAGTKKCEACGTKDGDPCCTSGNACGAQLNCEAGTCKLCGDSNLTCCASGTPCNLATLACAANTCTHCGLKTEPCCGTGDACSTAGEKLQCESGTCNACGGVGLSCCQASPACSNGLTCSSQKCTGCARQVAVGNQFACVVRMDDAVVCWGTKQAGQLGTGTAGSPVALPTGTTVTVTAGDHHACALKQDGSVYCWGDGSSTPVAVTFPAGGKVVEIEAGGGSSTTETCVRRDDGKVYCWAMGGSPAEVTMPAGKTPVQLSVGGSHKCILMTGNALYCMGRNGSGQLGNGTKVDSMTDLVQVMDGATPLLVSSVSAGNVHTCAVKTDNTAACWGDNALGQLGTGSTTPSSSAAPLPVQNVSTVASVAAANLHTCVRKPDSTLWCFGSNTAGQLAFPLATPDVPVPTPKQITGLTGSATALAAGGLASCAVRGADNTVWCWGNVTGSGPITSPTLGPVSCP